jgi:hypothetical protein
MPPLGAKVQPPQLVDTPGAPSYHFQRVKVFKVRSLNEIVLGVRSKLYGSFDCRTDIIAVHPAKVIYFAVPKVANSSFKRVIAQAIPDMPESRREKSHGKDNTVFSDPAIRRWLRKNKILLCKHQVPAYKEYLKLAFVRNPWDRLVSCYKQKISDREIDNPNKRGTARALAEAGFYSSNMSFADFARAVSQIPDERSDRHFRSQSSFLLDNKGVLLVDEVRRFEDLDQGFQYFRTVLGREDLELPHLKKTQRKEYRDYYDDETAELTAKRYARDIELFGYEF